MLGFPVQDRLDVVAAQPVRWDDVASLLFFEDQREPERDCGALRRLEAGDIALRWGFSCLALLVRREDGRVTEIRSRPSRRCRGTIVMGSFSARNETSNGVNGPMPLCTACEFEPIPENDRRRCCCSMRRDKQWDGNCLW
jgi:hypothetical protein